MDSIGHPGIGTGVIIEHEDRAWGEVGHPGVYVGKDGFVSMISVDVYQANG